MKSHFSISSLFSNKTLFRVLTSFIIIKQLVSVNGHLGYKTTSWNTQTRMYVWGIRYSHHILNLSKTLYFLRNIFFHINNLLTLHKDILFVSENNYIDSYLKKIIVSCKQFISSYRWLGGLLTNCRRVLLIIHLLKVKRYNVYLSKKIYFNKYRRFFKRKIKFYRVLFIKRKKYLRILNKYKRFDHIISGFSKLKGLPHFVIILNAIKSKWAVNEASASGVPSAAFIDSVGQLQNKKLHYLIPINTSSFGVQTLLCGLFSSQINFSYYYNFLKFLSFKRKLLRQQNKNFMNSKNHFKSNKKSFYPSKKNNINLVVSNKSSIIYKSKFKYNSKLFNKKSYLNNKIKN